MSGSRTHAEQLTYQCPECGNKFPVWKQMTSRNRERSQPGHIKDLYCYRCEVVTKHEQLSKYEPMFKEVNMNLNLIQRNDVWYADSREVAEMVDKDHAHLLRDIDGYKQILDQNPNLDSDQFFKESNYQAGTGKNYKLYFITRKGCDMVANKMTGEKGVLFTAAYVTKFEEMEKALQPVPQSRKQIIQAGYTALLSLVEEMKPKAEYFDQLVDRNGLMNFRDTAKELLVKESTFIGLLESRGYVYRDNKDRIKPIAEYVPELFELKEFTRNGFTSNQTLITQKGRDTFRKLCQNEFSRIIQGGSLCAK